MRIQAIAKYRIKNKVQHLLVAENNQWIECDPLTHQLAWNTLKKGGLFYASEQLPRRRPGEESFFRI